MPARHRLSELSEQHSLLCVRQEALMGLAVARGRPYADAQAQGYLGRVARLELLVADLRASVEAAEAAEAAECMAAMGHPLGLLTPELLDCIAAEAGPSSRPACRALLAAHDSTATAVRRNLSGWGAPRLIVGLPMLASLSVQVPHAPAQLRAAAARGGRLRSLQLYLATDHGAAAPAELAPALAQLTALERLRLVAPAERGVRRTPLLAQAIGALGALTDLDLDAGSCAAALAPALATLPRLRRLAVAGSDATALGLLQIADAPLARLRTLELRACGIRAVEDGDAAVSALAAALGRLPGLQRLVLDNDPVPFFWQNKNYLSGDSAAILAPALRALADLRSLQLAFCNVDDVAAAALAPALGSLTRLTLLSLASNDLSSPGVDALAPALAKLAELRVLRLSNNNINDGGAATLAAALPSMARLNELHLDHNRLANGGITALATSAARHGSMKELHVLKGQWDMRMGHSNVDEQAQRQRMGPPCTCRLL